MEKKFIEIQEFSESYQEWAETILTDYWFGPLIVSRGRRINASKLPGLIAVQSGDPVGLLTYQIRGKTCELVTLNALMPGLGIGSLLVQELKQLAERNGCVRIWLVTTNDNTPALRFYQRNGFVLVALHPNALVEYRRIKPQIPLTGLDDIPIRDELELEYLLAPNET